MSVANLARNFSSSSSPDPDPDPELVVHSVAVRKPGADGTNTDEGDTSTTCVRACSPPVCSPCVLPGVSVPSPVAGPGGRAATARDTSRNLSADTPGLNLTRCARLSVARRAPPGRLASITAAQSGSLATPRPKPLGAV